MKTFMLAFQFLLSFGLIANEPTIVKLAPPVLTKDTIDQKIVCTRPMREGFFNISLEKKENKTVVHCYGHGGSGWTTLFGSVNKAVNLFSSQNTNKQEPIRVIGSGCMGLTCAIELKRLGYNVIGITTKDLYEMPSWQAAGYFALVSLKTSPEEEESLNQIGMETFLTYQKIGQGKHPYIGKEAVCFLPVYCSLETDSGVENLEEQGLIPPKELVILDFGNGVIHPDYVKYMTYFLNTTTLMQQLTKEVKRLGIPIKIQTVHSIAELPEKIVFNCTGLGSAELNKDSALIPVRGHLISINEYSGTAHMDYMIYTKVKQDGKEEYIYLFPKNCSVTTSCPEGMPCAGVLGGTFIENADSLSLEKQKELDQIEFKRLLDRNALFFTGKPFSLNAD